MLNLVVQDREGKSISRHPIESKPEVIIGRAAEVEVPLLAKNVSPKHAKISRQGKRLLIEDLGSSNGVILNGTKINGPTEIADGAEIKIGDFTILLTSAGEAP